jgi:Lectin C-type domain
MKLLTIITCHAALLLALTATASVVQGPVVNPANGHSYFVLSSATWLNSEAEATTLGGHLVTINDAAENMWLTSTFAGYGPFFIGFTDMQTEGSFVWISGETDTYRNWGTGEPNDQFGAEDFGLLYPNPDVLQPGPGGFWNDGRIDHIANGVIEVVPEPSTALFGVVAFLAIFFRRPRSNQSAPARIDQPAL